MAQHTAAPVFFHLHTLPIIAGMVAVDDALGGNFRLRAGLSAETSGGLLVALPSAAAAEAFIAELAAADGKPAWVVGRVEPLGGRATESTAEIANDAAIVEVR